MVKVVANELTEGTVRFISLVKHGAIREPFRIVKSGDQMTIDLGRLFFQKTAKAAPSVGFVAVAKTIPLEMATKMVADAGFDISAVTEQDSGYLFSQKGYLATDTVTPVHLSNDVVIGLKNADDLAKGFEAYDWQSTDFKTMFAKEGAMPMVSVACSALMDTIYNVMSNSDKVETAKAMIDTVLGDFHSVVNQIVGGIPSTAFKLEDIVRKFDAPMGTIADADLGTSLKSWDDIADTLELVVKAAKATEDPDAAADKASIEHDQALTAMVAAAAAAKTAAHKLGRTKKGEEQVSEEKLDGGPGAQKVSPDDDLSATNEPGQAEDATQKTTPPAGSEGIDTSGDAGSWATAHKAIMDSIGKLAESVGAIASSQKEQGDTLTALKAEVATTATGLQKMDEALSLGVNSGEGAGDREPSLKSENDEEKGFLNIDTAFGDPFKKEADELLAQRQGRRRR